MIICDLMCLYSVPYFRRLKKPSPSTDQKQKGTWQRIWSRVALADTEEAEVLPREAYKKLSSGVIYVDIAVGNGKSVKEGSRVNLQWVLRKSNGYFVGIAPLCRSLPFIFTVGDPKGAFIVHGLDECVRT